MIFSKFQQPQHVTAQPAYMPNDYNQSSTSPVQPSVYNQGINNPPPGPPTGMNYCYSIFLDYDKSHCCLNFYLQEGNGVMGFVTVSKNQNVHRSYCYYCIDLLMIIYKGFTNLWPSCGCAIMFYGIWIMSQSKYFTP